jgi:hypothetical protein
MPYVVKRIKGGYVKGGYYVVNEKTGKRYSSYPMTKEQATRQLRALYLYAGDK